MTLPTKSPTKLPIFRPALTVILLFSLPFAHAANKALVIGNNNYSGKLSPLTNPTHDAKTVASALRDIGFSVTQKENVSREEFRLAMDNFADSLQSSDIAFIYYAGHGLAYDGKDYLLPISPSIKSLASVEFNAINAQEVLNVVSEKSAHTIFVVDSCRDNPFVRSAGTRGLGFMRPSRGSTYIFYAAKLGEVASDDGTFARVLAQELRQPQSIDDIRVKVWKAVNGRTNGNQNPNALNQLTVSTLYFLKPTTQSAPAVPAAKPAPQNNVVSAEKLHQQGVESYNRGDYQQTRQFWEEAAEQGHAQAQRDLGYLYYNGQGVTKDYRQAKYWYEKAAAQGHANAQNNLGYLYRNGLGVTQDYNQAKYWQEKAAAQGNVSAQFNLGDLYENVLKDFRQAKYWYEKAAVQGYVNAQYNLGYLYENALKDSRQAKVWYEKAAAQGLPEAKEALKRF